MEQGEPFQCSGFSLFVWKKGERKVNPTKLFTVRMEQGEAFRCVSETEGADSSLCRTHTFPSTMCLMGGISQTQPTRPRKSAAW